uniref:Elongation factor EFG domain-containing protein n=1 Tax=Plectus sambesii TaxID=2011161 RepID=A0A914UNA8_9BILA
MLTAGATLFEPIYAVEIQCPESAIGAIYRVLNQRRGHINDQSAIGSSPMFLVKAFVPVNESFGMTEALMSNTSGQAHPQCTFDHWQVVPGSPTDVGTLAGSLVQGIRRRKGARLEVPDLSFYLDKL